MLPTTQEYKIAMMIGEDSFRTLQNLEVIPHPSYPNEPWYSTGGLAIVFKIKMKEKFYALKCFYSEANERQERLEHIATYLKQNHSPYFVDFTYLDNELWVETAQGGNGYPVILMEWVEGKTLDNYLAEVCKIQGTAHLQNLYFQFCNLAWWLQQQPIAHGDLKHDNIIVTTEGKLKLIDYDGMFVPSLQGRKANEQGSPCYQHPQRDAYYFNEHLDDFSLLILQITLLALKRDPSLFKAHYNGDGILLKGTDYPSFAKSSIKAHLWRLDDLKIPLLLSQLQSNLHNLSSIDLIPLLQDVEWINWLISGQKNGILIIENQIIKEFALWNEECNRSFRIHFGLGYSLNESLLEQYQDRWSWGALSHNRKLPWTIKLIETYRDRWDWESLSKNIGLPWSADLIEIFKDMWAWDDLSSNKGIPWTIDLIETFKNKWSWDALSSNKDLPWSVDLIDEYYDRWAWDALSSNKDLPWSIDLIEIFIYDWYWEGLSSNIGLPWSIDLIETFKNKWSWHCLSSNEGLPWTTDLIEMYKDKWYWYFLSCNKGLPWTIDLIEMYENSWILEGLSNNSNLPWKVDLIKMYDDGWDWQELSGNEGLPWTLDLITMYEDWWDWRQLSSNKGLPLTIELLEKYKDRLDWEILSGNEGLQWTIELLEKYKDRLVWMNLLGNNRAVLSLLLDDTFIDEIMSSYMH